MPSAAVWEALLAMSAYASGLVTLRPMERMPSVPVVVQNAFQKLLKLQSSRDDEQCALRIEQQSVIANWRSSHFGSRLHWG